MPAPRLFALAVLLATAAALPVSAAESGPAVGAQYDTTHVYLAPNDVDRFVASFIATFGGSATKPVATTVTPTPSSTILRVLLTPVGNLSVFGFTTPAPYPFGQERTGYLVRDIDAAVEAARSAGAAIVVSVFDDPIGRDAVVQWPGGVNMQLYWHTTAPSLPALLSVPENRVYLPAEAVAAFVRDFTEFSHGAVVSDVARAPGIEIGRPGDSFRRIRIESAFGRMVLLVTDGHLPYPYGRELTGYEVANLSDTIDRAKAAGASVLAGPYGSDGREAAMLAFPGGYVAEIHAPARN
jgi:predicted enzyme related to lactoylglutathione lyase